MYSFEYPAGMTVGRVCFEISLKPFRELNEAYIRRKCIELFEQWKALLLKANAVSVLLWAGDGSEILDYRGNLDDEIEWCKYLGQAVQPDPPPAYDPDRKGLHGRPRHYMENPPMITYRDLRLIIAVLKQTGKESTGFDVSVGATFDPGPEFTRSGFKYRRHTEILSGVIGGEYGHDASKAYGKNWVHCTASLASDDTGYAAYPHGIPDNLPFGTFLGAQYRELASAVGYDYIWFSNGFGYSRDSWSWTGECFDGVAFSTGKGKAAREAILRFWNNFTEACPGVRIETRGSNLSTGMDISAHGTPLDKIYGFLPITPPNSPWAALDARFGLELAGYMSHIAVDCREGYLFRYYIHDPWWINSPWFDRFNRCPHDIYMPLSVARLDENLNVTQPYGINFLTADDSFGEMPWRCPTETIPYIMDAFSHYPDAPGPLTWVYPFDHYHKIGYSDERAGEVLFGDWFVSGALDSGMPLNTVIADRFFPGAAEKLAGRSIIVSIVPDAGSALEAAIMKALDMGGDVLLYGPAGHASDSLLSLLGIERSPAALEGVFSMESKLASDHAANGIFSGTLVHSALLSGGGLDMTAAGKTEACVLANSPEGVRAYCMFGKALSGRLAWVRGSFIAPGDPDARLPSAFSPSEHVMPGFYLRAILERFGITICFDKNSPDDACPIMLYSENGGALYITGYAPDTTGRMKLSLPDGAPVMTGTECIVEGSIAEYAQPRWWHNECRTFVRQAACGRISNIVRPSVFPGVDRRIYLTGLIDADVTFRTAPGTKARMVATASAARGDDDAAKETNVTIEELDGGRMLARHITGTLMICWGAGDSCPVIPLEWSGLN